MRNGQQTVPALLLVGTAWAASQQAPVHQVWQTISAQRTHSEAGQSVDDHVRIGLSRFGLVEVRFRMTQGSPAVTEVIAQARRFSVYTATEGLHLVAERSEIRVAGRIADVLAVWMLPNGHVGYHSADGMAHVKWRDAIRPPALRANPLPKETR